MTLDPGTGVGDVSEGAGKAFKRSLRGSVAKRKRKKMSSRVI